MPSPSPTPRTNFLKDVGEDEKAIVTAPFHLKKAELKWIVPLTLATGGVIALDRHTSRAVSRNGSLGPISHKVSYAGSTYSLIGLTGGMYLIGRATGSSRLRETGRLSAEALVDTALVTEGLQDAFER